MRRSVVAAMAGYAALAVAVFRPTPWQLAHTVPAWSGFANDALIYVWALAHVSRTLFVDPLHVFDAGIFHPARLTLAYSDHVIGQALVGLPIWLATQNPLLEYNLLVLLSYVLGAAAAFAYARALGLGNAAAAAGGLVFAFTPYRFHSPLWLQVLFTPFVPLALLAWLRFVRTRTVGAWVAWVACWTAHGLMGGYLMLYFGIVMGVLVLYTALAAPPPRDRRLLVGLAAAPLVMALLLAPTLVPYWILRSTPGHIRTFGVDTPLWFFLPGPGTLSAVTLGTEMLGRFGPGLAVWALALVGLVVTRDVPVRAGLPATFVRRAHLLGLAVTLALVLVPLDLQLRVPGLDMIRATNRAFFLSLFFVGMFVAEGVDRLLARPRSPAVRRALVVALGALLLADLGTPPHERVTLPVESDLPAAYRFVRDLPDDAIVYDQVNGPEPLARAMYLQAYHHKRMPTGYAGFWKPATEYVVHRLFRFPAPEALRLLRTLGVGWVVRRFPTADAAAAARLDAAAGIDVAMRDGAYVVYRIEPRAEPSPVPAMPLPHDGWTVSATLANDTLAAATDGDPATLWAAAVARAQPPALTIDLGTVRSVAGVRCATPLERAAGVQWSRVELSTDGTTFVTAPAGFEPPSLPMLYDAPDTVRAWEARFPPEPARFVRLTNAELAFWSGEWVIGDLDVLVPASP